LIIHGTKDWIVKDSHSKKLYNAAITPNKKLELIQDGLHAERLIQQYPAMMKQMISVWFKNTL
jgi:alpha-beta hydrolase superfamily lysophospholipase